MQLRWKLSTVFIALLIVPLLLIVGLHFKLKREVALYKTQLVSKGEKIEIRDWIPKHPTNATDGRILLDSIRPFSGLKTDRQPSTFRMVAPGRAQVIWKADEIYDWEFKKRTNVWELIKDDLEANGEILKALRSATEADEFVFPIAYEHGFRTLLPHLAPARQTAKWLAVYTIYNLHEGDKAEGGENLKALLRFVKASKNEPMLISHLVRLACLSIAWGVTWEALQYPGWTDAELKQFQDGWAAIEVEDLEAPFAMERAMGIQMLAEARLTGERPWMVLATGGGPSTFLDDLNEFATELMNDNVKGALKALFNKPNDRLWKWTQSYEEELTLMKMWQDGIDSSRQIRAEGSVQPTLKNLETKLESIEPVADEDALFPGSVLSKTLAKKANARIARQLAVAACALERYKLANGRYPNELVDLTPRFINSIPSDPIDGKPLRYRPETNGVFLLYSVGVNGIDEGGSGGRTNAVTNQWVRPPHPIQALDYVWPKAATEEQIEEWEQHEKK